MADDDLWNLHCPVANEVQSMLLEGRERDAEKLIRKHLLEGYTSPPLMRLVVEMRAPIERKIGRPKHFPARWYDIGKAMEEWRDLKEKGHEVPSYEVYRDALRQRFGHSESRIERADRFYRGAMRETLEIQREEWAAEDEAREKERRRS